MQRRLLTLALLAWGLTPAIEAQPDTVYYGLSIGEFDYSENAFGQVFDDAADSWRVLIDYQFLKHFAFEGYYGETSTVRATRPGPPPGTEIGFETEVSKILGFRALGTLPFDNGLSLMAGAGFSDVEQDVDFTLNGAPLFSREILDQSQITYYIGVQYDWERVAVRLGYEKFDLDIQSDAEEAALTFFFKL